MRRLCALALLAALGAASFVSVAPAQQPVIPQWVTDANQRKVIQPGANALPVQEQFPPTANVQFYPMVISSIFHNGIDAVNGNGMTNRDSTLVYDTRGYNRAALMVFFSPTSANDLDGGSADSLGAAVFALQMRYHVNALSDTNNTYLQLRPATTAAPLVANADSVGSLANLKFSTACCGASFKGWANRQILMPDERPVAVTNFGAGYPNRGMVVWSGSLSTSNLGNGVTPYISFRLRLIRTWWSAADGNPITTVAAADSTAAAVGTKAPRVRVRADLYLWRE